MSNYQIVTAVLANVIYVRVLYKLLHIFFTTSRSRGQENALYGAAYVVLTGAYIIWNEPEITMISNLLVIVGLTCCYSAEWIRRLIVTAFVYSMAFLCEMTVVEAVQVVGFSHYQDYTNKEYIIVQILCKLVTYLVAVWLASLDNLKDDQNVPSNYSLAIFAVPACTIYPTYVLLMAENESAWKLTLSVLLLFFLNGMVFYLYNWLIGLYQDKLSYQVTLEQNKMFERQLETEQEANDKMSRLRHDWNNSLLPILGQLEAGQHQNAEEALRDLLDEIKATQPIVTEIDPALAAVINYKLSDAQDSDIIVSLDVQLPSDLNEHINIQELSILLGNLLDNALRAVKGYEQEPYLTLKMSVKLGVLGIMLSNSFEGAVIQKDGEYKTTKDDQDNHGLGLKTVRRIVDKYQGDLEFISQGSDFTVKIKLFLQ